MKKTIRKYLKTNFPNSSIETIHGNYWIRFELGANLENGSLKRVDQAVSRALEIYKQTVGNGQIVILIEEYQSDLFDPSNEYKNYLYTLIAPEKLAKFNKYVGPFEQTYIETDENGNKKELLFEDRINCDLLIGQLTQSDLQIENILRGIANLEMGIKPCIPQNIYFFDPITTNCFYMYDDRGCDIWSHRKENLIHVYSNLSQWILDYDRAEIDLLFK